MKVLNKSIKDIFNSDDIYEFETTKYDYTNICNVLTTIFFKKLTKNDQYIKLYLLYPFCCEYADVSHFAIGCIYCVKLQTFEYLNFRTNYTNSRCFNCPNHLVKIIDNIPDNCLNIKELIINHGILI